MPRYLIERHFAEVANIPMNDEGRKLTQQMITNNAALGVTWLHSYVSPDRKQSFCVYDASSPEALREAAERNGVPTGRITEVSVLEPYFYSP
jgi:hypothetical protein